DLAIGVGMTVAPYAYRHLGTCAPAISINIVDAVRSLIKASSYNINLAVATVLSVEKEVLTTHARKGRPTIGGRIIAVGFGVLPAIGRTATEGVGVSAVGRECRAICLERIVSPGNPWPWGARWSWCRCCEAGDAHDFV